MGGSIGNIVRAAIGVSTFGLSEMAYYQPKEQRDAQREAMAAQQRAELEARRIASEKKPMEATATLGLPATQDSALGSLGLLIEGDPTKRKRSTGLGTGMSQTGLGFGG